MQRVKAQLDQLPPGSLVGYADFVQEPAQFAAVAAALSRSQILPNRAAWHIQ